MEFSFFITDNKSGYKTNQKWLEKNYPLELSKILSYSKDKIPESSSIKEKIWLFYNNLTSRPKCITCQKETIFSERFDRGYNKFCSLECINSNKEEMTKRVSVGVKKKYGVDFYPQHEDFVKKVKETKKIRYFNESYNNLEKNRNTKKERYGSETYNNFKLYEETCLEKYGVKNYSKTEEFEKKIHLYYKSLYPNLNIININKNQVVLKCENCDNLYVLDKQTIYYRVKTNSIVCTICNPIGQSSISSGEQSLLDFIKSLGVDVIQSHKILPSKRGLKKEIDIFLPKYNIGFEYNGIYFHNELFYENNYHLNKTNESKNLGIDLFHIFEDEWGYKRPIIESIIKNKLNKTENKIFARKCSIKEIDSKECSIFLEKNHIQGNVNSKVSLGLYYENELLSVMTFGKGRISMGGKSDEWELVRFCNKLNYSIIGGATKLFNFFIKKYNPNKVITYSDNRYFNGNLYEKLNFKKIHNSKPNYWYVINGLRYHRFGYRKSMLIKQGFDKNKTEHQIMLDRKIYRIYDCGNIRWEVTF